MVVRTKENEVCLYEPMFRAGLKLPFPRVVRELLSYLNLALDQIVPNTWRVFFACIVLWPKILGDAHPFTVLEFLWVYRLNKNPNSDVLFNF